jgi:hypothetical protein
LLIPIKAADLICIALRTDPKFEFGTDVQKLKNGVPQWSVQVYLSAIAEVAKVTVTTAESPSVVAGQPVSFNDMLVGAYATPAGRAGFYFIASGVTQ